MQTDLIVTGPLQVNSYLLVCKDTDTGAVIDPGGSEEDILRYFEGRGIDLKYIINTHGHPDHIACNPWLKERSGAQIVIHREDAPMLTSPDPMIAAYLPAGYEPVGADVLVEEGDSVVVGERTLRVIHTPGHTPGGICLYTDKVVFTGDTLFAGGIGRSDFPGGSHSLLIQSIERKLFPLAPEIKALPGHGPASTIGRERASNPFFNGGGVF